MRKIFTKIIALFLGLIVVFSGCSNAPEEEISQIIQKPQVHNYSVIETENYLVKDGKSDYKIVFSADSAKTYTSVAVNELLQFFKEATGITLKSSTDSGLTFNQTDKYISIGDTTLLEQSGIEYDLNELKSAGFILKTVGNSIFIIGGSKGELNGVYGLLNVYFGFKTYAADEIYLKTNVTEQKFLNLDCKDIPDIEYVHRPYKTEGNTHYRMHLTTTGEVYVGNRGAVWHNLLDGVIPFEIYGVDVNADVDVNGNAIDASIKNGILTHPMYAEKPEWFNHPEWYVMETRVDQDPLGNTQIIEPLQVNLTVSVDGWTAEQNARSQQLLYEVILYEMKEGLKTSNIREMAFTAEDNSYWSEDAISKENFEKYGTNTAEYIQCANYIATEIKKEYPDFRMTIFAYSGLKKAPTKLNANGEYEAIDQSVILADNVDVLFCYQRQNRTTEFMDETENMVSIELEKSWAPLVKQRAAWVYGINYYQNFFVPSPNMMGIPDNYRHFFENDYRYIYDEGQSGIVVATDWAVLKLYLVSEYGWNVYQDYNKLVNDFFNNYFKAAAEPMLEAYNIEQNRLSQLGLEVEDLTNIMGNSDAAIRAMTKESSWPDNLLQQILEKFDQAFKAIEIYKDSDPVLYNTLYNRINLETLSIRWMRAEIYGKYYGQLKSEWMMSIYKDAKALGITHFESQKTLDQYFLG